MLREPAALALARIGDEFAVEALVQVLNGRDAPTEAIRKSLVIFTTGLRRSMGKARISRACADVLFGRPAFRI